MSKHIHQYKRVKWGEKFVYRCILPDCKGHYLTKEFIEGRIGLCPRCKNPFQLTKALIHKKVEPHCADCTIRKVKTEQPIIETISNELLASLFEKDKTE